MNERAAYFVGAARERIDTLTPDLLAAGVSRVWLFGSRARGEFFCMDWDFCLEFSRPVFPSEYFQLKRAFAREFRSKIDFCSPQYPFGWEGQFSANVAADAVEIFNVQTLCPPIPQIST